MHAPVACILLAAPIENLSAVRFKDDKVVVSVNLTILAVGYHAC